MDIQQKLGGEARALLEQGKVDYLIGFAPGTLKFTTTPLITKNKDDADRLVINPFIVNNLSLFIRETKGRVTVVAKPCDSRSIVSLVQDNKLNRKNIIIIGITCPGLIDVSKVEKLTGKDRDEIENITVSGDKVTVTVDGKAKEFAAKEVLFDECLSCENPAPKEYDILVGELSHPTCDAELSRASIKKLEEMPLAQRWEYWREQFSHCIRCYACRQVCPSCFCERCIVEETEPLWVNPVPRWQDNLLFQVSRMLHVAGRCVDCGECERACPVKIPLRSLSKKMDEIVVELFGYKTGTDINAKPLLTSYEAREAEDLIR